MADNAQDKPQKSPADKERSRQQSRSVSGREAARSVGEAGRSGQRGQRGGSGRQGAQRGQGGQAAQGRQGQRPQAAQSPRQRNRPQQGRPISQRPSGARGPRPGVRPRGAPGRSRQGLFIWGSVGLVIVIVIVLVVVNLTGSKATNVIVTPKPVSSTVTNEITHIKTSVYNTVGTGAAANINPPRALTGQSALTFDGKPGFFYMGGEFCPFCAAERWAMIAALSRFGTFSGLETMASSSIDVHPSTQSFTFAKAKYTSPYLSARLIEYYGQDKATGTHPVIAHVTKQESNLVSSYGTPTNPHASNNSIPFVDIGNKVIVSGASYTPQLLQGLTRTQIAADLSTATNPVTQAIVGTSNYISAGICAMDGAKPANVCSSSGVQAAAKALGLSI